MYGIRVPVFAGKNLHETIDEIFEGPFANPLVFWLPILGAGVGLLCGSVRGFIVAGIGGAIAYALGGVFIVGLGGYLFAIWLRYIIRAVPSAVLILFIAATVWGIHILWGVGKP
jgi:hypothetical protein